MANEMLWTTQSGFLSNVELNRDFQRQAQPLLRFRQFTSFKNALGKNSGESVNWLQVSNLSNRGKQIAETSTMPETVQPLAWGTLSVAEYGNSVPFSFKVETLSKFDVQRILREGLLDDAVKSIDGLIERQFNATPLYYVGTATGGGAVTTNGTATATNTSALNSYHVRKMRLQLEQRNVPTWNGEYAMIASLEALESLESSIESVHQYTESGVERIYAGEVGRLHGVRFIKDGYATRNVYDSSAGTDTAITWSGALSGVGYMFGKPTVMEALTIPEEIRMKVTTDYGRSKGIGWYMMAGWKIMWGSAANARIIKWDSAA